MSSVKKLSPSEPTINMEFTIESPRNYPITRLEKLIRTKHGFSTRFNPPVIKFNAVTELSRFGELLSKLRELINDLRRESLDFVICVNYRIVVYSAECLCRENSLSYISLGNRVFCISRVDERYIYMYCNKSRNCVTIKYFVRNPVSIPDPIQVTPSIFTYCSSLSELLSYLESEVKYNLDLIKKYIA